METLDYDHEIFGAIQQEADKALAVRFFVEPTKNEQASIEAGRPIYEDVQWIEIRVRGDRNQIIVRPVQDYDKARFSRAYEAFSKGLAAVTTGTPLSEWPAMSTSSVKELNYLGIYSVEDLTVVSDGVAVKVPGLVSLREKAKKYLEIAKGGAPIEKAQKDLEDMSSRLETAERNLAEATKQLEKLAKDNTTLASKLAEKIK